MKKSVIKRRKRVVPAAQGSQIGGIDVASNSMGSPESDNGSPPADSQRGSMNPDGSVNLGFRLRNLPDPTAARGQGQQLPSSDLMAYTSTSSQNQNHSQEHLESLNNHNRLPPMTSYPPPHQNRSSLSPNSFLSPSRKRSFSATEIEPLPALSDPSQPKRLSSIKSILNPGFSESDRDTRNDRRSPIQYTAAPSPGMSSGYATSPANSGVGSAFNSGRDPQSETERAKLDRRELLQREAEKMREALKAKERELAELGMGE